jgi:hypothetical protein
MSKDMDRAVLSVMASVIRIALWAALAFVALAVVLAVALNLQRTGDPTLALWLLAVVGFLAGLGGLAYLAAGSIAARRQSLGASPRKSSSGV